MRTLCAYMRGGKSAPTSSGWPASLATKRRQAFSARCKFLMTPGLSPQSLQSIIGAQQMRRSNRFITKLFSQDRQCSRTLHRPSFPTRARDLSSLFTAISFPFLSEFASKPGINLGTAGTKLAQETRVPAVQIIAP